MASRFHCPLLGGDTVATPGPLTLSVTALGAVAAGAMVRRTTASPGDALYVSGTIGDATLGLVLREAELGQTPEPGWAKKLSPQQREMLVERYLSPQPRQKLVPALRAASAAMDVSDGLIGDLRALMRASSARAQVDLRQIPLSEAASTALALEPTLFDRLVCGGDDYEILCAVPPQATASFEFWATEAGVPVTALGVVVASGEEEVFLGPDGKGQSFVNDRFSHF
jgi:thiamine-monophosphate kinase